MVDGGVWNNSVFVHKWEDTVQVQAIKGERESRKMNLAFSEYNNGFSQEKHTVCFSMHSKESKFYIHLVNDDKVQDHDNQGEINILYDPDPCFAKIVAGKDAVDELHNLNKEAIATKETLFSAIKSVKRVFPRENVIKILSGK